MDTHTNWMTLSKPSISKRLSVSEAPSSRDSFPGDKRETVGQASRPSLSRAHLGKGPWPETPGTAGPRWAWIPPLSSDWGPAA